ncbi:MAG TPA: hypothetical protein PLQ67_00040 [Burkholderiaceae bacterium]|nr:hypothetical protein [Burkholderiaceae bacterium]
MSYKVVLSALATALTVIAFVPYARAIVSGAARPHVFSWIIWGTSTFVVFLATLDAQGGVGAWPIGVSGVITLWIAALAYARRSDVTITKSDWAFFIAALSSLPLWYATSDPLWAVLVLTSVDLLGFGPTLRKVYRQPHSEPLLFFALLAVRNLLVIFALEVYSPTTVLFPAAIGWACVCLIAMAVHRRRSQHI